MVKIFPQHSCCQYSNYRGVGSCQIYSSAFNPQTGEPLDSQRRRNPIGNEINSALEIDLLDPKDEFKYENLFC
jgi:hypothetical protein